MPENEKIPVTVYQIDLSQFEEEQFEEIVEIIIKRANKDLSDTESYTPEKIQISNHPNFQVRLFSSLRLSVPRWRKFLLPILDDSSRLKNCNNRTYSFICFINYSEQTFAVTGGLGNSSIDQFVSQNFGLEILVRLFEKDSKVIKSIQDRGVTGIVLGQTKFYRGDQRFSDENQFGKIFKQVNAELNKKILTKTFGFSEEELKRTKSGCLAKSSFQINKAICFETLLVLIQKFTEILTLKEKFILNKVYLISKRNPQNKKKLNELNECLIQKLYEDSLNGNSFNIDFCHKDFEKYLSASCFTIELEPGETIEFNDPPSLEEIIKELKRRNRYIDNEQIDFKYSVLWRTIKTYDENVFLTGGNILQHLHGELVYQNNTYFFVDEEWYKILPEFIKELDQECSQTLNEIWDDNLIKDIFNLKGREIDFNIQFIGKQGWLVFDTITPENIEMCDILQYDSTSITLIHVKKGFDNSVRELTSQINISAKRLLEDLKSGYHYIDDVELRAKRGSISLNNNLRKIAGQNFPKGGLKQLFQNKRLTNITFCLAFVDTSSKKRLLKDHVCDYKSSIAKYSLLELKKGIIGMGFSFKVIQLKNNYA